MKNITFFFVFLTLGIYLTAQNTYKQEIKKFQEELNKKYADSATSPLTKKDLATFKSLDFYPVKEKYRVVAKYTRTSDAVPFKMQTTTDRAPEYVKYGEVEFTVKEKNIKVNIYQSIRLRKTEKYKEVII